MILPELSDLMSLTETWGQGVGGGFKIPGYKSKGKDKREADAIIQQSWPAIFYEIQGKRTT